jgi:hypothetical protein
MAKREKSYRCAACNFRLHSEAYYCKKCGALVDPTQAPDARKVDTSLITRYNRFISMSPFSKLAWGLLIVAAAASFTYFFGNLFHASTDNNSSNTFVLKVETPYRPFTCSGVVCHVSLSIENKSDAAAVLTGDAYMRGPDDKLHGPADPAHATGRIISYGNLYCQKNFHITIQPHETIQTVGICVEGINPGDLVKQVLIKDKSGRTIVTTDLNIAVPQ